MSGGGAAAVWMGSLMVLDFVRDERVDIEAPMLKALLPAIVKLLERHASVRQEKNTLYGGFHNAITVRTALTHDVVTWTGAVD